jgi:(4S)-4-hydroxy-5-phosphonooxypentane-2,3-dione isomerase
MLAALGRTAIRLSAAPSSRSGRSSMYVVCVTVHVTPGHEEAFLEATRENARQSREREPGNARFDILQAEADPQRFFLYEAYRTQEDFVGHQHTPHYLTWKASVAPWMAVPRQGVRHVSRFPAEADW